MLFPDTEGTDPILTATPRSLFVGIVSVPDRMRHEADHHRPGAARVSSSIATALNTFQSLIKEHQDAGKRLSGVLRLRGLLAYASISSDQHPLGCDDHVSLSLGTLDESHR